MKKSHVWDTIEILEVQCPYCKSDFEEDNCCIEEGDIINCKYCYKDFELGEQR